MNESFSCSSSSKAFYVVSILDFSHSNRCVVIDHCLIYLFIFKKDFIYLFDRERSQEDGEAVREREKGKQAPPVQRAQRGTRSQDPEIMT